MMTPVELRQEQRETSVLLADRPEVRAGPVGLRPE